ncbi:MAG: galactose-1-phosphate uridylyltransferase [Nitrospinae bacterium]|nr:galactose-1-phosphate uridylyltransferase [Nitrospinota bacterium]
MPELRRDPVVGRWVIISTERSQRPSDFKLQPGPKHEGFCAFCPGNEDTTPREVLAYRPLNSEPNKPGWTVRVVPNKYPALRIEGPLGKRPEGMFDKMNGIGAHEVIIETPDHNASLATLPLRHVEEVLWAFRDRILDLQKDERFRYTLVFKNHGAAAGASLEHPHSQLIALPIIPNLVQEELEGCDRYYRYHDRCIYCDMIQQEMQAQGRVVLENAEFIALAPFASRFPFEVCLLPKAHNASFEKVHSGEYSHLAALLQEVLQRMFSLLTDPPYNILFHSAPSFDDCEHYYHWHVEIMPRLTGVAGFEWGTGFHINPTPPEEAARFLREVPETEDG